MPICPVCWTEFPVHSGPVCARCGDSVDRSLLETGPAASALCRACRLASPPFVRAVAFAPYQGRMKDAIHALKYDRLHPAARGLGQMLAQAIAQLAAEAPTQMLVVPVPLHRTKSTQRGFNQARSLAVEALGFLRKSHPQWRLALATGILVRQRATDSQAGLTPRQRRINLRGAFSVPDPSAVASRHVLIVDDILTTGATARAASLALMRAGASSVWVATLARARRTNQINQSFSAQQAEQYEELAGTVPPAAWQKASGFSSQDQPSF